MRRISKLCLTSILLTLAVGVSSNLVGETKSNMPNRILVFADTSGSLDSYYFGKAMEAVSGFLPDLFRDYSVDRVSIIPWSNIGSVYSLAAHTVTLPRGEFTTFQPDSSIEGELALFTGYFEEHLRQQHDRFKVDSTVAAIHYDSLLSSSIDTCESLLSSVRQGKSDCTAFQSLMRRIANDEKDAICFIVSDAKAECQTMEAIPKSATSCCVLFLVPSQGELAEDRAMQGLLERRELLGELYPWLIVISWFQLEDVSSARIQSDPRMSAK